MQTEGTSLGAVAKRTETPPIYSYLMSYFNASFDRRGGYNVLWREVKQERQIEADNTLNGMAIPRYSTKGNMTSDHPATSRLLFRLRSRSSRLKDTHAVYIPSG